MWCGSKKRNKKGENNAKQGARNGKDEFEIRGREKFKPERDKKKL